MFFAQSVGDNTTVPIDFGDTRGIAVYVVAFRSDMGYPPDVMICLSGYNAKLDIYTSGDAAYDVAVKNLVVTRGQVTSEYMRSSSS